MNKENFYNEKVKAHAHSFINQLEIVNLKLFIIVYIYVYTLIYQNKYQNIIINK